MIATKKRLYLLLSGALLVLVVASPGFAEEKAGISLSEIAETATAVAESGSLGELFNINNATPEMLAKIPGVGEQLGQAIAAYRDSNGAFTQLQDLINVEGIDATLLEKIKPFLQL